MPLHWDAQMNRDNTDKMRLVMGLWMKHQSTVTAYIASVVRDRHHVEDIAQEVAHAISSQVDRYEADRPFLPWALGIAHNQILKYLRTRKRDRLVFDDGLLDQLAHQHIKQADGSATRKAALHECMQRLNSDRKQLLQDRYFDKVGVKTIAKQLDRSEGAVSMLLLRVRQQLANCIRKRLSAPSEGKAYLPPSSSPSAMHSSSPSTQRTCSPQNRPESSTPGYTKRPNYWRPSHSSPSSKSTSVHCWSKKTRPIRATGTWS